MKREREREANGIVTKQKTDKDSYSGEYCCCYSTTVLLAVLRCYSIAGTQAAGNPIQGLDGAGNDTTVVARTTSTAHVMQGSREGSGPHADSRPPFLPPVVLLAAHCGSEAGMVACFELRCL